MNNTNKNSSTGNSSIGILGLLQVAFIIMKIAKIIDWSWWMVFIPSYISIGIGLLIILITIIILKKK